MKNNVLIVLVLSAFLFQAFKPKEDTKVSYSKQVVKLLENRCYNCHGESSGYYSLKLNTYESLKAVVENGSFRKAVIDKKTMPARASWAVADTLTREELTMLDSWMVQGASNN